jgi:hypothetical protein
MADTENDEEERANGDEEGGTGAVS